MNEKEMRDRIKQKRIEAQTAGEIHRRDLMREIHHLEKELKTYAYYQNQARKRIPA